MLRWPGDRVKILSIWTINEVGKLPAKALVRRSKQK
jgi:hypothetical protein